MLDLPDDAVMLGEKVAYTTGNDGYAHGLLIWHDCDHRLWVGQGREAFDADPDALNGWLPVGVEAHTLVSMDPLHIEPSLLLPDCCGLHGFIRGGKWIGA